METDYQKLLADAKAYCNARYDLLRLELLDKMSRILGMILMALVVILLVFAVLAFLGLALVFLLSKVLPMWASCCIMAAVMLLLMALIVVFRTQWFVNPMVRALSGILFAENGEEVASAKNEEESRYAEDD